MSKQYGHPLQLNGFGPDSSAVPLKPIRFQKSATESAPYDEAWLQRLIMRHPGILPVDHIEPGFSPLVPICIELPMPSGSLDNLLVTPRGDLALVECKLWRNPQARREVIAQLIDYAKDVSSWSYEQLEQAIRKATSAGGCGDIVKQSLFELAAQNGELDEATFHDAVSRNLKRGRFLLLIVGDGIHEAAEKLGEFLQQHAGSQFTLAFVDIALFETPDGKFIAQPRVLTKTTIIDRGTVTLQDGRLVITPPAATATDPTGAGRKTSITEEKFFELMELAFPGITPRLRAFLEAASACDIYPDFGTESMILRWSPEGGRDWNFGIISKRGQLWTDHLGKLAHNLNLSAEHKRFLESIAKLVPDAEIRKTPKETAWFVSRNRTYITIDTLLADQERGEGWVRAIKEFQDAVKKAAPDA